MLLGWGEGCGSRRSVNSCGVGEDEDASGWLLSLSPGEVVVVGHDYRQQELREAGWAVHAGALTPLHGCRLLPWRVKRERELVRLSLGIGWLCGREAPVSS